MNDFINVVVCLDDGYVMPTGVLLTSIELMTTDMPIMYHVVTTGLKKENIDLLSKCIRKPDSKMEFYTVDKSYLKDCPVREGDHISLGTYLRLLLPKVLPADLKKVIYLDGDIICVDTLSTLWNIDVRKYALACCINMSAIDIRKIERLQLKHDTIYFNAGVLSINLDYWRKKDISNKCMKFIAENPEACELHDQDALNKILEGSVKLISPRYNVSPPFYGELTDLLLPRASYPSIKEAIADPCLIHQWIIPKPWKNDSYQPFTKLWRRYLQLSPFKSYRDRSIKSFVMKIMRKLMVKYTGKKFITAENDPVELKLLDMLKKVK